MDNRFSDEERAFFRKLKDERSNSCLAILLPVLTIIILVVDIYLGDGTPGDLLFSPFTILGIISLSLLCFTSQLVTELRFRKQYLSHRSPKSITLMFVRIGFSVAVVLGVYWSVRFMLQ